MKEEGWIKMPCLALFILHPSAFILPTGPATVPTGEQ